MKDKRIEQKIVRLLSDGPKSFEELSQDIFGCDCSGRYTRSEKDRVASIVRDMHQSDKVSYTVDRRVELEQ